MYCRFDELDLSVLNSQPIVIRSNSAILRDPWIFFTYTYYTKWNILYAFFTNSVDIEFFQNYDSTLRGDEFIYNSDYDGNSSSRNDATGTSESVWLSFVREYAIYLLITISD